MAHKKQTFWYKLSAFLGKKLIAFVEFFIARTIVSKTIFNKKDFPWIAFFEQNYEIIKTEYTVLKNTKAAYDITTISVEQQGVIESNRWDFVPLYLYGIPIVENIELCPKTNVLLKNIPNFTTVFFSVLKPGANIKPHRGAFKGYLRFHFGVDIPRDYRNCGICVLNETYHWKNGESLIFDDTFIHDAWNRSDSSRVLLYVDFIRPMPRILVLTSMGLTKLIGKSAYIQNAIKNLKSIH